MTWDIKVARRGDGQIDIIADAGGRFGTTSTMTFNKSGARWLADALWRAAYDPEDLPEPCVEKETDR